MTHVAWALGQLIITGALPIIWLALLRIYWRRNGVKHRICYRKVINRNCLSYMGASNNQPCGLAPPPAMEML